MKPLFTDQISNEENKQPSSMNSVDCEMIALEKYKLEVEQRVSRMLIDFEWHFLFF